MNDAGNQTIPSQGRTTSRTAPAIRTRRCCGIDETEAAGFLDKLVLVEEAPALESSEPIEDSGDYLMPNDYVLSEVFSGYLLGVLNKAGFKSTGQVFGQTDDVLLDIKGISNKSLEKIRQIQ